LQISDWGKGAAIPFPNLQSEIFNLKFKDRPKPGFLKEALRPTGGSNKIPFPYSFAFFRKEKGLTMKNGDPPVGRGAYFRV
jgi:hypothetical protein